LALPQNAGAPAPELVNAEPELRHLHIEFVREVDGNLRTSSVRVHGDVQAVYGPVGSWDERLAMSPGGNPGPGVVWITADTLGVTEDPAAKLAKAPTRQFELEATARAPGRVTIEGQDPRQGAFTAYGHRSTYNQTKGLFILEGDGITPATIEQQQVPGGISSPQSAQRMIFNHNTGSVRVEGLHKGQFNQIQTPQQSRQPEASPFR
jgi:lipopolysaccharide export system protein LptA